MNRWVSRLATDDTATIDPPPLRTIAAPASRKTRNTPVSVTPRMRFHSSVEVATTGPIVPSPAEATTILSVWSASASATAAATSASAVTSPADVRTRTPSGACWRSCSAAASSLSAVRPISVTSAPSATSAAAAANPMPLPPPVTRAERP